VKKTIEEVNLAGFAITSAAAGQPINIQVKDSVTSDSPLFYGYAEQIANILAPKLGHPFFRSQVNYYLVLIHPDNTADVYWDDFKVVAQIKVNRTISAGALVEAASIDDIEEVRFPDITIGADDRVIFLVRSGWRFGIFFDLTASVDVDVLARDIARLQKGLALEDVLRRALADIQSKGADAELSARDHGGRTYDAFVITEGATDWMHLEKAFRKISYDRRLEYSKPDRELGDSGLLDLCRLAVHGAPQRVPIVCVFDRDNPKVATELNKAGGAETEFQSWGNNVFSMMLPRPESRKDYENINIEMYYPNEVLKRVTPDGKRLVFDNEVKIERLPGRQIRTVLIPAVAALEFTKKVYSKDVAGIENESGTKVAMSKTRFAELIRTEQAPFEQVSFEACRSVTVVLEKIILLARATTPARGMIA
jgi:hypothetical protein